MNTALHGLPGEVAVERHHPHFPPPMISPTLDYSWWRWTRSPTCHRFGGWLGEKLKLTPYNPCADLMW